MGRVKGGGSRKFGRNSDKCAKYRQENKKEKSKIKKYQKMLKKLQDNSGTAINLKKLIMELERKISGG